MVEVRRTAARFQPERGTVGARVMALAHHPPWTGVRPAQATADRGNRSASREATPAFDEVSEQVETRLSHEQVRGCLRALTPPQRKAITLAHYDGLNYRKVEESLSAPLGTIMTRLRDALIRLRGRVS
ncbi:hypothetical protein LHJ74_16245 [Streptomyces sp. N2-109]|uniref:RNA polymerase sigma factor 70 region 4 type 2 domain-containing protein n=1 Tax=Streptomyces gossypii TaxID=2883101 RepID=A0ABT2JUD3_9ACTN|nr:sigma factor-like helix-turn-helix DNA-binding protein [Streptomyces gossypii]MCT2591436.1 hypothetical protein [Streptomyces gossypii]